MLRALSVPAILAVAEMITIDLLDQKRTQKCLRKKGSVWEKIGEI